MAGVSQIIEKKEEKKRKKEDFALFGLFKTKFIF